MRLYARLECKKVGEELVRIEEGLEEHLYNVTVVAASLADRLYGDKLIVKASCLAGALHDIGKVLHNLVYRWLVERLLRGCTTEGRLSFFYHEVLSAAIYATAAWLSGWMERLDRMAARAVLLHHQGLRGLEANVYIEGAARIAGLLARVDEQAARNAMYIVLSGAAKRLEDSRVCGDIAERLWRLAELLREARITIAAALEHAAVILPRIASLVESDARTARIVAGMLMIADNAVVKLCVPNSTEASIYTEEAKWIASRVLGPEAPCSKQT